MDLDNNHRRVFCFQDMSYINNRYYFPMLSEDVLVSMNSDGSDFKIEYVFPRSKAYRAYVFHTCFLYGGYLIFVPYSGAFIALYNIKNKKFKKMLISKVTDDEKNGFIYGMQHENKLYFFTPNDFHVLGVDITLLLKNVEDETKHFSTVFTWYNINPDFPIEKRYLFYFGYDYVIVKNKLYTIVKNTDCIVEFDLDKGEVSYNFCGINFASICHDKEKIFFLDENCGTLYTYNYISHEINKFFSDEMLISPAGMSVIKSIMHNGWLYIWKDFSDEVTMVNIEKMEVASLYLGECTNAKPFSLKKIAQKTASWKVVSDCVFFISMAHNKIYHLKNGKCVHECTFPPESWKDKLDIYFSRLVDESVYMENRFVHADKFFDLIFKNGILTKKISNNMCGKKIYEECMR